MHPKSYISAIQFLTRLLHVSHIEGVNFRYVSDSPFGIFPAWCSPDHGWKQELCWRGGQAQRRGWTRERENPNTPFSLLLCLRFCLRYSSSHKTSEMQNYRNRRFVGTQRVRNFFEKLWTVTHFRLHQFTQQEFLYSSHPKKVRPKYVQENYQKFLSSVQHSWH